MEEVKINLPKLGESILSATVVQWFKKVGDHVQLDEPLLEVSTDKVNSEIPSPVSGVLKAILAGPDEELQVGEALAIISTSADAHAAAGPSIAQPAKTASSDMRDFFSPGLLRLAKEKGISLEEMERIQGTGEGGRLTKKDLEAHCEKKPCPAKPACSAMPRTSLPAGDVERVKMTGMRKAIADNMVRSFYEAPHASLITEVDVTDILKLIQDRKEEFLAKYQVKLTITSFVVKAIAKALL
ncbi:MAG TPA: biotin/lipoyl-containing protein, partial [Rhabdochlamydiaceae bacterium]